MQPSTFWVIDHPAHVHILAASICSGSDRDRIIAVDRPEVRNLLDDENSPLPLRPLLWVPRPAGSGVNRFQKIWIAGKRLQKVKRWIRTHERGERMVAVNAGIDLVAGMRAGIVERMVLVDTEIDEKSLQLIRKAATHVIVPSYWRKDLDGGWLKSIEHLDIKVTRHDLLHPELHMKTTPSFKQERNSILVRHLHGDGGHDDNEIEHIGDLLTKMDRPLVQWIEREKIDRPWNGPYRALAHAGVISQSTTVACEAAILGIPTLLVSSAKRGFIDEIILRGAPLWRVNEYDLWLEKVNVDSQKQEGFIQSNDLDSIRIILSGIAE